MARIFAPACAALLIVLVLMLVGSYLTTQPLLISVTAEWNKLVALVLFIAIGLAANAAYRLWRWRYGRGVDCPACGGLLESKRQGRFGPHRRCMACNKNISRVSYAR